jgi:predicted amidophosphoribosyltransferase
MILKVKIHNSYPMLQSLLFLFTSSTLVQSIAAQCDQIYSAPSSLRSRLRGRFDLATFFAIELAHKCKKIYKPLPWSAYFQTKKRSQIINRKKLPLNFAEAKTFTKKVPYLLVDDIITTGHTFKRMEAYLNGSSFYLLTFADAYHVGTK